MRAADTPTTSPPRGKKRAGRPTLEDAKLIRERILEGATSVFLEQGFLGARMDDIAERSCVSKQAVYAYFISKNLLFEALVERLGIVLFEPRVVPPAEESGAPREALRRFGHEVMSHLSQRTFAVVAGEARNLPALAQLYWEQGPSQFRRRLRAYLEEQVRQGSLDIADLTFATEQMQSLFTGPLISRLVMGRPSFFEQKADLERWIDQAVEIFLQTYSPGDR